MSVISRDDFIESIADGLQYISFYHPRDFVQAMTRAWEREESEAARNAIGQILVNSQMAAQGRRPICQDTGIVVVFLKVGMQVRFDSDLSVQEMVDEGVRRAYSNAENPLRASVVSPPWGKRLNTGDNTPAVIHTELVPGDQLNVTLAAKGGGSENKARFANLNPSDDLVEWVVETVPGMGAGWCPPGILGLGLGGTPEKALLMAKESLMAPIDMDQIIARGPADDVERLRLTIYQRVNETGIGAQGLGGLTTVLDVKLLDYPTHAASLPVAMIPNCAATRHIHFELDGTGPAELTPPSLDEWPQIPNDISSKGRRVDVDQLTREEIRDWRPGENLLLCGKILTGRDAAHKRIADLIEQGQPLPDGVDFRNRLIYYVGPVDPVGDEAVGPAGPTTATRMDKFTDMMLDKTGLLGMIGKAERGPVAIEAIRVHRSVYLIAVGGAAYLVSKAIRSARLIAFEDLGMEAIYEFEVQDMPVTVAVDSSGESVHQSGPAHWRSRIAEFPVSVA
ncbi:MAG: fumarate hydratase [Proteobacteria bacterium]|jgi:fumarate hydratase class I|nr:fumarate hydratase [Pseudomonadota bacterium]MBP09854.1 fumarate hydratase [Acidiferrobacteraceae bacterium]MDP7218891.1 fumarate hydratase [Arenicellales bacterium]HJP10087.1 fumarate hydratase [Arenicellales bacterium]|tara:strand:- start:9137 stop:10660 length:1524 start_codon:yes stop_codon:yes gene_type:complete